MIERRQQNECPKCKGKIKAIMGNDMCCVGIGCNHIYRKNIYKFRDGDKTIVELKKEWA